MEHQAALVEVARAMAVFLDDPQPVFNLIVQRARAVCGAADAALYEYDGALAHRRAPVNEAAVAEPRAAFGQSNPRALRDNPEAAVNTAIAEPRIVHVRDTEAERGVIEAARRSRIVVPLIRDFQCVGAIALANEKPDGFSDTQITLLRSFAEQAVIAMERARLLTERRAALGRQAATAAVLRVINESPGDLAPVCDIILEKTLGCQNHRSARPGIIIHRIALGEGIVHVTDVRDDDAYRNRVPQRVALADLGGARSALAVALRKDGVLYGALLVYRQEVRAYTAEQIDLVKGFAAQAVIAMHNARLIIEQREALDRQTAMADVLRVINESPGDLQPVFETIWKRRISSAGRRAGI